MGLNDSISAYISNKLNNINYIDSHGYPTQDVEFYQDPVKF